VRKLAERSQKAAGEIGSLSSKTLSLSANANVKLTALIPDIKKTADLIQEIAAASNEQSRGAEQIAKGVTQLDTVVQQNASSSEELSATAEELSGQAASLSETIGFFKVKESSEHGVKRAAPPERPARAALPEKTAVSVPVPAGRQKGEGIVSVNLDANDAKDSDFDEF